MSLATAAISFAVLKWLRVDFAETWALIVFLLNYIPSIGSTLAVVFPAILALVQFDSTWQFLLIVSTLTVTHFVIGNVIEPAYMGRTLNLSPFVVIASLVFWSMVWGVPGAFLSIPLTVAFVVVCSRIPSVRWIAVLLAGPTTSFVVDRDANQTETDKGLAGSGEPAAEQT
jgi:AI-2 transport protein TqsA